MTAYDANVLATKSQAVRLEAAGSYMGSHKGATGPVCSTPDAAATAYKARYPTARACTVVAVKEGPAPGLVTTDYRAPSIAYALTKAGAVRSV
jgi:hypothetical protein